MAMSAPPHPVGFRFYPTEEQLIDHYLKNKIKGHDFNDVIPEIDICSYEPGDLPGFSLIRSDDDDEWFYFSRPDYKTKGNSRNRATEKGFWKITGAEREIRARRSKALIGKKRTLTFYRGKVRSGLKTGWVIHEYFIPETLLPNAAKQRDFVLCRLKKKDEGIDNGSYNGGEVCEPNTNNASDFQNLMEDFGSRSIPEDLQITLQENTRPEDIFATLFSAHESPPSPDYFASILGDGFLHANAGSDVSYVLQAGCDDGDYSLEDRSRTTLFNHSSEPDGFLHANASSDVSYVLQAGCDDGDYSLEDRSRTTLFNHSSEPDGFLHANAGSGVTYVLQADCNDLEDGDYSLKDRSRTTLFNHSSEPKSLHKVYNEIIHGQGQSIRDKNATLLNQYLQKNASPVNFAANLPQNIGRVRSVNEESEHKVCAVFFGSDMLSRATNKSYQKESAPRKLEMVTTGRGQEQSETKLPQLSINYVTQSKVNNIIAESSQGQVKQGFKLQEVRYTSKVPEKPKEAEKPNFPEKPKAPEKPWRNDERKIIKRKPAGITRGDWKSSFIVWKESPLSLRSYPPVVYAWNIIGGFILFIFFVGELISCGKW